MVKKGESENVGFLKEGKDTIYPITGLVEARGAGLFRFITLCEKRCELKIQMGNDIYEIYGGLGAGIITSDYFQSSLHPAEEEVSLLSTLYPEIVELITDFGGICEKV